MTVTKGHSDSPDSLTFLQKRLDTCLEKQVYNMYSVGDIVFIFELKLAKASCFGLIVFSNSYIPAIVICRYLF